MKTVRLNLRVQSDNIRKMTTSQQALTNAVRERDADAFEDALVGCVEHGLFEGLCEILTSTLEQDWHTRHEDVAQAIQELKCVCAISALERTATNCPEHLAWDDNFALARKCTWALADIGTASAREALERLAKADVAKVSGFANRRLENWADEILRKRGD
jgi:hypothetical protein